MVLDNDDFIYVWFFVYYVFEKVIDYIIGCMELMQMRMMVINLCWYVNKCYLYVMEMVKGVIDQNDIMGLVGIFIFNFLDVYGVFFFLGIFFDYIVSVNSIILDD